MQKGPRVPSSALLIMVLLNYVWLFSGPRAQAFALLGPYADWMDVTNGFRQPGDIGGPMNIGEEYRWNVPVLTYGFDPSFLDYFGSNGVAAVESAIKVINDLPPASILALTNFPTDSQRVNYAAQAAGLSDLKSAALAALVEHLGLAQPMRNVFSVRMWSTNLEPYVYLDSGLDAATNIIASYLLERNFDPITLSPSQYVNGTLYSGYVFYLAFGANGIPTYVDINEFPVDPLDTTDNAVADNAITGSAGAFYTGLTYDDAGGISFLHSTNRFVTEGVLPGVQSAVAGGGFVNVALRSGVDKVSFIPQPTNAAGGFQMLTNFFTDAYVTNAQIVHQQLERVVEEPDFLFTVDDTGRDKPDTQLVVRSDTSSWVNNSSVNGRVGGLGPGVIAPPVKITFHRMGGYVVTGEPTPEKGAEYVAALWGSFDQTTNPPTAFPTFSPGTARPLSVRLRLTSTQPPSYTRQLFLSHTWQLPVPIGGTALLQTSTNCLDWLPVMTVTNNGGVVEWFHNGPFSSKRFFKIAAQ